MEQQNILTIEGNTAKQIQDLVLNFDIKKGNRLVLQNHIKMYLNEQPTETNSREWLVLDTGEDEKKRLLHLSMPLFMSWVFDSNDLTMVCIDSYTDSVKYYEKAKDIFRQLGYKIGANNFIRSLKKKPPLCIKSCSTTSPIELTKYIKNQISQSSIFGIRCNCGNTNFRIKGLINKESNIVVDQISVICTKCSTEIYIFDSTRNGYDGVLLHNQSNEVEEVEKKQFSCPYCFKEEFDVAFGFEHSIDKDEANELIQENCLDVGAEDLFTWLIGVSKCISCKEVIEFSSIECS
jgi:Zn finger protein HypA/HybF involved in hydrogenase expression